MNQHQLEILQKNNQQSRQATREALTTALLLLLQEKEYLNISITELCQKAGVSRTAFYRNYKSKDEVLDDKIMDYAYKLRQNIDEDLYQSWLNTFQFVERHKTDFEVVIKAGLEYKILLALSVHLPTDPELRTLQSIWDTVAYVLMIEWVIHQTPKTAKDMANLAYQETKQLRRYWGEKET
ncbi:TetR/AcrR family transcriptional regulator [Streptococcus pneumoniae]